MPTRVERVPGKPILIATLTGQITAELLKEMFEQSARLADGMGDRIYRITDVSNVEVDFGGLVLALATASSEKQPGSSADPRFIGMLVGSHKWSQIFAESIKQEQYGHINIPLFEGMDAAMTHIEEQMKTQK
jgi:hypothetical protein